MLIVEAFQTKYKLAALSKFENVFMGYLRMCEWICQMSQVWEDFYEMTCVMKGVISMLAW